MTEPEDLFGHNSMNEATKQQLRSLVERVERLEADKVALNEDVKEVMGEVSSNGFDKKIFKRVLALRKMERDERIEQQMLVDLYLDSVGEKG